ncbi:hypothetical protein [Bordetella sp. LUAb4]|uniref:hypothetical protein n=1 Tax=Bordetella sp. LUAb4 TaxID=2843195 RepID=UPI001E514400|nr:hypothetical protein [Bordetella sp. LUAb4]
MNKGNKGGEKMPALDDIAYQPHLLSQMQAFFSAARAIAAGGQALKPSRIKAEAASEGAPVAAVQQATAPEICQNPAFRP